jgi:hypothetical protein
MAHLLRPSSFQIGTDNLDEVVGSISEELAGSGHLTPDLDFHIGLVSGVAAVVTFFCMAIPLTVNGTLVLRRDVTDSAVQTDVVVMLFVYSPPALRGILPPQPCYLFTEAHAGPEWRTRLAAVA